MPTQPSHFTHIFGLPRTVSGRSRRAEPVQRTVQEELWHEVGPGPLGHWAGLLQDYVRFYNRHRLHGVLGYVPSAEYAL